MNQVVSFERIIYFGFIQEQAKDPALAEMTPPQKRKLKGAGPGGFAFGSSVER